jgi:hypothetical protein
MDHDRRSEMDLRVGDSVLINAAAFTASRFRNREAIPCDLLEMNADRLLVRTHPPYRVFAMWVSREWIEDADRLAESVG